MTRKITSPEALKALRDEARSALDVREGGKDVRLTMHMGTCGIAAGARDVLAALLNELGRAETRHVGLTQSGCAGLCDQEPMLTLADAAGGVFRYGRLDGRKAAEIVREHVLRGRPVTEYLIKG